MRRASRIKVKIFFVKKFAFVLFTGIRGNR